MDMISHNFYYGYINLADPRIIAAENSQKDNPHLGKAMKAEDCEDLIKVTEKEIEYLTTEDIWTILPKLSLPTSEHIIRLK